MTISVLLADDQHLVRAGFRSLLKRDKDITIVGEVSTGGEAVRAARTSRPDVILMDIRMPSLDGIAATKQITVDPALLDSRVVILTTFETDELLSPASPGGWSARPITRAIAKLGVRDRVRLVIIAYEDGLVGPLS
jgi:DNA-binding NarL/FixJ family response regulator